MTKQIKISHALLLLVNASLMAISAEAANAQAQPADEAPETISVQARAPIPFRKFEMRDPATKKLLPGSTILTIDGEPITAKEYFAKLNATEKKLAALGYTLRDGDENGDADDVVLDSTPDAVALAQQVDSNEQQAAQPDAAKMNALSTTSGQSNGNTICNKAFSYTAGAPKTIYVNASGNVTATGNRKQLTVAGSAFCVGGILGHQWTLAQATGNLQHNGNSYTERFQFSIGGQKIVDESNAGNEIYKHTKDYSTSLKRSVTVTVELGSIPVDCTVGFSGSIGATWTIDIKTNSIVGTVVPHSNLTGYGSVSVHVNLLVLKATAGVEANLTLLAYQGTLTGTANVASDTKGTYVATGANYAHTLNMLSGKIDAYAQAKYWFFGWHKHKWTWVLFSWKGYKNQSTVFDAHDKAYL